MAGCSRHRSLFSSGRWARYSGLSRWAGAGGACHLAFCALDVEGPARLIPFGFAPPPPKRQHLFGSASSLWIYNWIQGRVWCACVVVVCDVVRRRNRKEKSFDIIRLEFSSSSRVIPSSHIPLSLSFQRFQLPVICPFSLLKTTTTTPFERETTADAGALFPFLFFSARVGGLLFGLFFISFWRRLLCLDITTS